ncbi:Clp protease N-terminal domain-containing protein [Fodinicola feengrottensis]|uniref:Clp protease N-terminal domain-containing protein n=1 Tax=Fodinicola feengrottensis TaxID=435914 RepID=A0ABN2FQN8_9ACTN|nr:Clp protease N-terminal domain-containing protein [Fodinicola feengrottensis]
MFERFTKNARRVVQDSVSIADGGQVGTRHLLAAMVADRESRAAQVLAQVGVDEPGLAELMTAVEAADRRGGLSVADVDALAGIGIDVDEVIDTVERNWGSGALTPRPPRVGRLESRFGAAVKRVLEQALRAAVDNGERQLDDTHLLLGLLKGDDPLAHELAARDITYLRVRALLASNALS